MTEKSKVQDPTVNWARDSGWLVIRFTPFGERGWPDHIFIAPKGMQIWVEFKRPGEPYDGLQEYRGAALRSYNQYVCCFDDYRKCVAFLKTHMESTRLPTPGDFYDAVPRFGGFVPRSWPWKD